MSMFSMEYRELYDLNIGGKVSYKPLPWIEVSAGGNKRIYFRDTVDAMTDTTLYAAPGKDRTS
jgi:hypothetical protein